MGREWEVCPWHTATLCPLSLFSVPRSPSAAGTNLKLEQAVGIWVKQETERGEPGWHSEQTRWVWRWAARGGRRLVEGLVGTPSRGTAGAGDPELCPHRCEQGARSACTKPTARSRPKALRYQWFLPLQQKFGLTSGYKLSPKLEH